MCDVFCFQSRGFYVQSSLLSQISNVRYFIFNICRFCIQSSLCSQRGNIMYFVFNLCGFRIRSSSSNLFSNTRYLVFSPYNFCLHSAFLYNTIVLSISLSTSSIFVSITSLSESYRALFTNELVLGI